MSETIALPTIHLNGSSRESLLREYQAAYQALIAFRDAFKAIDFHPRDYFLKDNYPQARSQRDIQALHINELMTYLERHLVHLTSTDDSTPPMPALPPDPQGMNGRRAEWASKAVVAYAKCNLGLASSPAELLGYILCNLHHWADRQGIDYRACAAAAASHYQTETTPN